MRFVRAPWAGARPGRLRDGGVRILEVEGGIEVTGLMTPRGQAHKLTLKTLRVSASEIVAAVQGRG